MSRLPSFTIVRCAAVAAALLAASTVSHAESVAGRWTGDFAIPAFDGEVSACAIQDGRFIVAGDFRWAGESPVRNVAMWTGSEWTQLGDGLPSWVNCLAVKDARLIAGIEFATPGSSPVMEFDGLSWRPLGPELYGSVDALLVDGADVYAAGQIYFEGRSNGYRVARWNGTAWTTVGGLFDGRIRSLAMFRGELHAGGEFLYAETAFASRIARWDGAHWKTVGGGTGPGGGVHVAALEVFEDRLIAGGLFSSMGGTTAYGIGAWDGHVWAPLPSAPFAVQVTDLVAEGTRLHVSGVLQVPGEWASGLVTLDGGEWRLGESYPGWGIEDVAVGDGKLIAVGSHTGLLARVPQGTRNPSRDVVVRDDSWHDLPAWKSSMRGLLGPGYTYVASLVEHRGELIAGGYFQHAADPPSWRETGGLARWDGASWHPVGPPMNGYAWQLISAGSRLIAAGDLSVGDVSSSVLAWNGSVWDDLGDPLSGYVNGLTAWREGVVAVGGLNRVNGGEFLSVAFNRGSRWESLNGAPISKEAQPRAVAVHRGDLYIGGTSIPVPGLGVSSVARLTDAGWSAVPGAPSLSVQTIVSFQNELWIGGYSYSSGSAVWRWNGSGWSMAGALLGNVVRLIEKDGELFASGAFHLEGNETTLARWSGTEWQPIEGAPEKSVNAMAVVGENLYIGGWFTRAGNQQAEGIARWSGFASLPRPGLVRFAAPWPSPARERVTFRVSLRNSGRVQLVLHDLRGAVVATAIDEVLPAGSHERAWSLPRGTRAGVYFARLTSPDGPAVAKVVVAP